MIDTMKQTLYTVSASNKRNEKLITRLTAQIAELQKMVKKSGGQKPAQQQARLRQEQPEEGQACRGKKSREEEKEDYDGNHDNGAQASGNTEK